MKYTVVSLNEFTTPAAGINLIVGGLQGRTETYWTSIIRSVNFFYSLTLETMNRKQISSGAVWEDRIGYSRAVRVGNTIEVAGTTATNGESVVGRGSPYEQTKHILETIEQALKQAGAGLKDVVRTRIYVTNIRHWEEIGKAHQEVFKDIKPASSMVQVAALINPEHLVEIEATAILNPDTEFLTHSTDPYYEV